MPAGRKDRWPEERIARLRALHAEGVSFAEIGRRLGVSKNAVGSKADRLDLPGRPSPVRRLTEPKPTRAKLLARGGSTLPPLASEEHTDA
jgi:hypothetical protein